MRGGANLPARLIGNLGQLQDFHGMGEAADRKRAARPGLDEPRGHSCGLGTDADRSWYGQLFQAAGEVRGAPVGVIFHRQIETDRTNHNLAGI